MVGVGGRSKGCQTCRERHVKCDETHPTCKRCEKANIPCGGYHRPRVWVDETPRLKRAISGDGTRKSRKEKPGLVKSFDASNSVTTVSFTNSPPSMTTGSPLSMSFSPQLVDLTTTPTMTMSDQALTPSSLPELDFTDVSFLNSDGSMWDTMVQTPLMHEIMNMSGSNNHGFATDEEIVSGLIPFNDLSFKLPRTLGLGGFEDSIYVQYTVSQLFFGTPDIYAYGQPESWLSSVNSLPNAPPMVKQAVQSLSATFFGKMHSQQDIMNKGALMYGKALNNLNKALRDPKDAWSLETLVSTMSLSVYEMVANTTPLAWLHHAGGTAKLIELRGPKRHKKGLERAIYLTNRAIIAISALANRRRTFLAKEEWKTVPWEDDPETKTSKDRLVDILCDVPGLVEDCDGVYASELGGTPALAKRAQISQLTGELMAKLIKWRLGFEVENPGCCVEISTDVVGVSVDKDGPLFPNVLHYKSLSEAADIALYNSILLMLLNINQFITGEVFSFDSQIAQTERTNPLYLPGDTSSYHELAIEICRSLEYHLLPVHSNAGSFFVLFPARVAYYALTPTSREAKWIEAVLQKVADLSGFEVSRTVLMDYPAFDQCPAEAIPAMV